MIEKVKYCMTAINKLTRRREIVSKAFGSKDEADKARNILLATKPDKRPYIYPLTVKHPKQLNLFTNQLDV